MTPESSRETQARESYDDAGARATTASDDAARDRETKAREAVRREEAHRSETNPSEEASSEQAKAKAVVEDPPGASEKTKPEADGKLLSKGSRLSEDEPDSETAAAIESKEPPETDKRDRLLRVAGNEKGIDQEILAALSASKNASPAPKSGEAGLRGVAAKEAESGDAESEAAALAAAKETKATANERGASARRSLDPGTVGKGASASDLGPRELPRRTSEGEGPKRAVPDSDRESGSEKESGKSAIRTTVVNRARSNGQSDEGGGHKSALQDSSGRGDVRFVGESADPGRTETTGIETGRTAPTPASSTGNTSSLEGSRDLAPRHLQQQLKEFATGDVVRHARFVLKENAGGEIRLLLKPEQLGTVRVRLEVQDNRIAGRIIVENTTVRDAFEQTLSELQRAFREAGLETGSLEVTVGQDGQASGQRSAAQGRRARAIEELAESVPQIIGELEEPRMINVYA